MPMAADDERTGNSKAYYTPGKLRCVKQGANLGSPGRGDQAGGSSVRRASRVDAISSYRPRVSRRREMSTIEQR